MLCFKEGQENETKVEFSLSDFYQCNTDADDGLCDCTVPSAADELTDR